MPQAEIDAHRARASTRNIRVIRGTSANPDTYFQSREATNPWYDAVYDHVEQAMNDFSAATGLSISRLNITGIRKRNG